MTAVSWYRDSETQVIHCGTEDDGTVTAECGRAFSLLRMVEVSLRTVEVPGGGSPPGSCCEDCVMAVIGHAEDYPTRMIAVLNAHRHRSEQPGHRALTTIAVLAALVTVAALILCAYLGWPR